MRENDQQLGKPLRAYVGSQAAIEALSLVALDEGCVGYASDIDALGSFDGAVWDWASGDLSGGGTATRVAFWSGAKALSSDAKLYWDNANKRFGVGTASPDRPSHTEVLDTETVTVAYAKRLTHITSNMAAASFGVGEEHELEDNVGTHQVASEVATLWADPQNAQEVPLRRWTTYPGGRGGAGGPGWMGFGTVHSVDGTSQTIIPNGTGDVRRGGRFVYCIWLTTAEIFSSGTIEATAGGGAVDLYNAGGEQFTLTVAADGVVTVARALGTDTAEIVIMACWIH